MQAREEGTIPCAHYGLHCNAHARQYVHDRRTGMLVASWLAVGLVSLIRTQRHAKLLLLSITGSIIIDARRGALHA
jgi:hypothetical protein